MSLLGRNPVLNDMLARRMTLDDRGQPVELHSCIDAATAEALYRHVRNQKPRIAVEVGMANAISTLAILTALEENGGEGRLISIDPNQSTQWRNAGRTSVGRAGLAHRHQVLEEADWLALPGLLERGMSLDFGYIDGWHTFDYALLDFWYLDKMTPAGGVVAFKDCGWPAVTKAIDFVRTHRRYAEMDVGLPKSFEPPNGLGSVLRKLKHRRLHDYWRQQQDRYFRKLEQWEPSWDFYAAF